MDDEAEHGGAHRVWGPMLFVLTALAQGVIPYTHRLSFGHGFEITTRPGRLPIVRDVVNAAGIGLLVCTAATVAFAACFVSLCGAYGEEAREPRAVAKRTMLRKAWLYPLLGFLGLPSMVVLWASPESARDAAQWLALAAMVVPLFAFISGIKRGAEATGISPGWAWLVVLVPLLLAFSAEAILIGFPPGGGLLDPWIPEMFTAEAP
jgi:hypothetical protein